MFTIENFVRGITNATRNLTAAIQDNALVITRVSHDYETDEDREETFARIPLEQIQPIADLLTDDYICADMMLIKRDYIEVAVQSQDRNRPAAFMRSDQGVFEENEHNYQFITSKASPKYIFALFCSFHNSPDKYDVSPMRFFSRDVITSAEDFFDHFRLYTVKVTSPQRHSVTELKRIFDAYIFNVAYNFNVPLAVSDFTVERRFRRISTRRGGQLFPYKQYKQDLTKYYQQALATNLPFMQYLAFYHVAEFFFQSILEDEAFQVISNFITRPSFSPYKHEDVRNFYNVIKKKMRDQREDGVWNEKNGLLLCLKRYVPDLSVLKASIDRIDSTAVDYYRTASVSFADDGKTVDFDDEAEKIYSAIRDRIYATRNAVVHSKHGERLRYEPFKHDKQLAKEIPLIRAVAEEIIINSAEHINYNFVDAQQTPPQ